MCCDSWGRRESDRTERLTKLGAIRYHPTSFLVKHGQVDMGHDHGQLFAADTQKKKLLSLFESESPKGSEWHFNRRKQAALYSLFSLLFQFSYTNQVLSLFL